MIPPLAPGQTEVQQNMVGWKNTFNMRQVTLMNLTASQTGMKNGNQLSYMRAGCITSPAKSLDILRKNLQSAINKDIDHIIKKYLEKFFQPAVNNIRANLGKDSVNEDHIKCVCRQMLEEAKHMYSTLPSSRDSSPYDCSDSEVGSLADGRIGRMSPLHSKRKESDTDSETGHGIVQKKHKYRVFKPYESPLHKLPPKREGPKWSPDRITHNTLFIMGARANKVLGFGQTRGRLYVRHPDLFRYSGDQEDKEWLASKNLMPPSGGKAYIMLLEDIHELTMSDDYRNSLNLQLNELKGFEAPHFMISKMRTFIDSVRTDKKLIQTGGFDLFDFPSQTAFSTAADSAPSTPSDTIQLLESHSVSTTSSKQSDTSNFIHIPETSPGSNNSFMSGPLAQSPLPTSNSLSPNILTGISTDMSNANGIVLPDSSHSGNSLSDLIPNQNCSDNSQEF